MNISQLTVYRDYRIPEVRKIVESMVTSKFYEFTKILLQENRLIFTVSDTLLYCIPLKVFPNSVEDAGVVDVAVNYQDLASFKFGQDECNIKSDYNIYLEMTHVLNNLNYAGIIDGVYDNRIVAFNPDLRSDEKFEELLNLKADQGAKYYRMNTTDLSSTIFVPVFAGFPNINKQDKIGIKVYNIDGNVIIELDIFKKKINRDIKIIYRTIGL